MFWESEGYFKPIKYIKEQGQKKDSFLLSFSKFSAQLVSCVLLSIGVLVLIHQVFLPWFFYRQEDTFFTSVPSSFSPTILAQERLSAKHQVLGAFSQTPSYFELYIPKLKILSAKVKINDAALSPDDSLGHYPNSALPGEIGNIFIFGHSSLSALYNPNNYKTIFSTLARLEEGDLIYIDYLGKTYIYVVQDSQVKTPDNVDPLDTIAPRYLEKQYLTLMTCVPPGLDTKRLLVTALLLGAR